MMSTRRDGAGHATGAHGPIPPLQHRLALGRAFGLLHVVWVIADDAIGVFPGAVTSYGGGQAVANRPEVLTEGTDVRGIDERGRFDERPGLEPPSYRRPAEASFAGPAG